VLRPTVKLILFSPVSAAASCSTSTVPSGAVSGSEQTGTSSLLTRESGSASGSESMQSSVIGANGTTSVMTPTMVGSVAMTATNMAATDGPVIGLPIGVDAPPERVDLYPRTHAGGLV